VRLVRAVRPVAADGRGRLRRPRHLPHAALRRPLWLAVRRRVAARLPSGGHAPRALRRLAGRQAEMIPAWIVSTCVALTVFAVMFAIGLSITPGELRQVWRSRPGPML